MNNSVDRFSVLYAVCSSTGQSPPWGVRLSTAVTSTMLVVSPPLHPLLSYISICTPCFHTRWTYCSAKQLIKAIQVERENLEVINCPQLQLSAKTSS
ncbi:hypothetical protein T10_7514, partial [Trichinella papuae]